MITSYKSIWYTYAILITQHSQNDDVNIIYPKYKIIILCEVGCVHSVECGTVEWWNSVMVR